MWKIMIVRWTIGKCGRAAGENIKEDKEKIGKELRS
jgi:hypothetical protein